MQQITKPASTEAVSALSQCLASFGTMIRKFIFRHPRVENYEAWSEKGFVYFCTAEHIEAKKAQGLIGEDATFLHTIEATSWEQALAVHNARLENGEIGGGVGVGVGPT